jgi:FtsP/CotA-like multicopper oxidase with cupredoxin domain
MKKIFTMLCLAAYASPAIAQTPHRMREMHETQPTDSSRPGLVVYHLTISDTMVNYTGKERMAIAINGSIPGPTLYFTEGDTAVIYIHNHMGMKTSLHWHGLIVPNEFDGVPYLTTPPVAPGQTYRAKFPIVQNGTYWYHSHSMLQEQSQEHGALIIYPRRKEGPWTEGVTRKDGGATERKERVTGTGQGATPMKEYTLLLSDWTDEKPEQVHRRLHTATEWYGIKKGSAQDYAAAIREGHFNTKLTDEWKRILAMDVSDVAYDRFLANGRQEIEWPSAHPGKFGQPDEPGQPPLQPGEKIRLRIINGAASTYFWLQYAGSKLTVVASDGKDVTPVEVDRMIIGGSETYDVVVTVPENHRYELRATAEDRTGFTSLWLGNGTKIAAPTLPRLNYFEGMQMMNGMMKMNGDLDTKGMQMHNQTMDMNMVMYPEIMGGSSQAGNEKDTGMKMDNMPEMQMTGGSAGSLVTLNYGMLRSPVKTTLPAAPEKILHFNLTGNMNRYVWSINNRTVSEADKILIRKGENVKIILYNNTMMRHPMHLHGHFFRLLNGQGDYAPLKNVVDIMPMETDTLEFAGTESGDWFFHCHILYHMMSGMGRIFHYEDSPPNPATGDPARAMKKVYADDRMIYPSGKIGLESNGSDGEITLASTRYRLQTEWRVGTDAQKGYESESHFGRYLGRMQYWLPYVGWDFRYRRNNPGEKNLFGQQDTKNQRSVVCAGVEYLLPMLVVGDARVDSKGNLRLQLSREDIAITPRLRWSFMVNTDKEFMAGFRYIFTKYFALSTHYDSDMGWGGGVTFNY